jgi:hypothetical protein
MAHRLRAATLASRRCAAFVLTAIACCLMSPTRLFAAPPTRAPSAIKLVQFGWGMPTPVQLEANQKIAEQLPFDGVVVALHAGLPVFKHEAYDDTMFADDRAHLKMVSRGHLTDNFVMIWATSDADWDWASESDWAAALKNFRNFARTARAGNFRGLMFDAECYGPSPWNFATQPGAAKLGFAAYQTLVYRRGLEFGKVIEEELRHAVLLMPWGPVSVMDRTHQPPPGTQRAVFLAKSSYGLYPQFIRGVLDASHETRLVDGNEASYYAVLDEDFRSATARLKSEIAAEIAKTSGPAHALRYELGHSVYIDWLTDPTGSDKMLGYYMTRPEDRDAVLEQAVNGAITNSDSYVLIYSENIQWWKEPFPKTLASAIAEGRARSASGDKPTEYVATLVAEALAKLKAAQH